MRVKFIIVEQGYIYLIIPVRAKVGEETALISSPQNANQNAASREGFSEYVAHLQLHMALQARNLVPSLNNQGNDSRDELLRQTQADFEKFVSRQTLS